MEHNVFHLSREKKCGTLEKVEKDFLGNGKVVFVNVVILIKGWIAFITVFDPFNSMVQE